jgi:FKBP-type peptidyl-prolyl cis-trans isomerase SlyD
MSLSTSSQVVADRKVVTFTYVILDTAGHVLEQSDLPMAYIHGVDGKMFPKVEAGMNGANIGDEIEVPLAASEAFGTPDPELIFTDAIDHVPPTYRRVGAEAMLQNEAGETKTMVVTRIADGEITLDGNHPFAGKDLVFRVTIVGVRDATTPEQQSGEVIDLAGPFGMQ